MVRFRGPNKSLADVFLEESSSIGESIGGLFGALEKQRQAKQEQEEEEQRRQNTLRLAQDYGVDLNQPYDIIEDQLKNRQKMEQEIEQSIIGESFKPNKGSSSFTGMAMDYMRGQPASGEVPGVTPETLSNIQQLRSIMRPGQRSPQQQQQQQQMRPDQQQQYQVGNQQIPLSEKNITPQMRDQMAQQQSIQQPEQQEEAGGGLAGLLQNPLEALSVGGSAILQQTIGGYGDLADATTRLMDWATPEQLKLNPEEASKRRDAIQEEMYNMRPGSPEFEEAQLGLRVIDQMEKSGTGDDAFGTAQKYIPTTKNIQEYTEKKAKGTVFEPYVTADTPTKKQARKIGEYVGLIFRPMDAMKKGYGSFFGQLGKATGMSIGADAAGWATERVTGSKTAGDVVTHGSLMAYTLLPGSFGKTASDKYNKFREEVINPAVKDNKLIDRRLLEDNFKKVAKEVDRLPQAGEAYQKISPYMGRFQEMAESATNINPQTLWTEAKELNRIRSNIPEEGRRAFDGIVKSYKEALQNFGNTIRPGSGDLLREADSLYKSAAQMKNVQDTARDKLMPRNFGEGTMLWITGGYPLAIAGGLGYVGQKYAAEMLKNPSMRNMMGQFFKQAARGNAANLNKLAEKMNKKALNINPVAAEALMSQARDPNADESIGV